MALKSGLAAQLGLKEETSWGVPATVDQFVPLVSETMTHEVERLESAGIIAGRQLLTDDQWADGNIVASGDVQLELYNRSMGRLWEAAFGTVDTSGSDPYTHVFWVANERPSLTVQVGKPSVAGTVEPWTFPGCKVSEMDVAFAAGELVTCGVSLVGKWGIRHREITDADYSNEGTVVVSADADFNSDDVGKPISGGSVTAGVTITSVSADGGTAHLSGTTSADGTDVTLQVGVALAAASFASDLVPYTFRHGAATVAGSSVNVKSGNFKITNAMDYERRFIGQGQVSEPLLNELAMIDGALTLEFEDETQYDTYVSGGTVALNLAFDAGGDNSAEINATVRYDGSTPQVAGRGIVEQEVPFKVVAGASDAAAFSGTIINSDAAV